MSSKLWVFSLFLAFTFAVGAYAVEDKHFKFSNGAEVLVKWIDGQASIFYVQPGKPARHIGKAKAHQYTTDPESVAGQPFLITIDNASRQTPNGKSTLAIFPEGMVVNYPIDKMESASFGTQMVGDTLVLAASFVKGSGNNKVFISPNPNPTSLPGEIPSLVSVAIPGTQLSTEKAGLINWNQTQVLLGKKAGEFNLRVAVPNADTNANPNALGHALGKEQVPTTQVDAEIEAYRAANARNAGIPPTPSTAPTVRAAAPIHPKPTEKPAEPQAKHPTLKENIQFKNGKLVFTTDSSKEIPIATNLSKGLKKAAGGVLTGTTPIEYKGENYTLLKVFQTPDGKGNGELFLIRNDGKQIRFGFSSDSLTPSIQDGILSLPGTERQLDLDRFDREATHQSLSSDPLRNTSGESIDAIAEAKSVFMDLTARAKANPEESIKIPSHEKFLNENVRPAMAQEGSGNIAVYGRGGSKRAVADNLIQGIVAGQYPEIPRTWRVMQLNASSLGTGTGVVGATQTREGAIEQFSKLIPTFWLAPDFETLKGVGSSSGNNSDSLSRLVPLLENGSMKMIALLSEAGYTNAIAMDPSLRSLFQGAKLKEPSTEEVVETLTQALRNSDKDVPNPGSAEWGSFREALADVVRISGDLDPVNAQPDKAKRLLNHIFAAKVVRGDKLTLLKGDAQRSAVLLYQADPMLFDPVLRAEKLAGLIPHLDEKLVGMKHGKQKVQQGFINVLTPMGQNDPEPRNKLLFSGKPGTGKTAIVEAAAKYMGLPFDIPIAMNNYANDSDLEQFLYDVASKVRTNAYTVLIFDELEKASPDVQAAALQMLQNGEFSARDSMEGKTSTRSTVVTTNASFDYTTNAGQAYTMEVYLGLRKFDDQEFRRILHEGGISEPLIDRINAVVPTFPFKPDLFEVATRKAIEKFIKQYPDKATAPLTVKGVDEFVAALKDHYFDPETQKPRTDSRGEHYLVNGRLVNRIIRDNLRDPVSRERGLNPTANCVNLTLKLSPSGENVLE